VTFLSLAVSPLGAAAGPELPSGRQVPISVSAARDGSLLTDRPDGPKKIDIEAKYQHIKF
jgi:hypothetical protein